MANAVQAARNAAKGSAARIAATGSAAKQFVVKASVARRVPSRAAMAVVVRVLAARKSVYAVRRGTRVVAAASVVRGRAAKRLGFAAGHNTRVAATTNAALANAARTALAARSAATRDKPAVIRNAVTERVAAKDVAPVFRVAMTREIAAKVNAAVRTTTSAANRAANAVSDKTVAPKTPTAASTASWATAAPMVRLAAGRTTVATKKSSVPIKARAFVATLVWLRAVSLVVPSTAVNPANIVATTASAATSPAISASTTGHFPAE